jgi:predicted pyridoxine 5'-phosphate oxidase superfamily flavin-nucleotide-binding protein
VRHRYFDLAFTPAVQAEQARHGSRAAYAAAAAGEDGVEALSGRERAFLSAVDTFFLASVSETGWPYVQHRGGPPGFVRVLNGTTIGWAEFAGNRQYVSAGNTGTDDRVALIFVDFAHRRRLKLLGHLQSFEVADRPDLVLRFALDGYPARIERLAVVIVEGLDWNCPQHITPRFTAEEFAALGASS